MKKLTQLFLTTSLCLGAGTAMSQVFIDEDFSSGIPGNFSATSFATTTTTTCSSNAIRANLYNTTYNYADLITNDEPASGGQIDISFDYKIINWSGGGATPATFGTLELKHSIDGGTTWATDTIIDATNHQPSTNCATVSTFTTAVEVPAGSNVRYALEANWATGDYWMYIENWSIIEQVTCPAPSNLHPVMSGTTTATLDFDVNATAASYQYEYGAVGFTPGTGTGTTGIVTALPFEIQGLTADMEYDVYVRNICSPGDTSGYAGAAMINTYGQGLFMDHRPDCPTQGFVDISSTGTSENLADDGNVGVSLPFALFYQGQTVNNISIGNNGGIILGTATGFVPTGGTINGANTGIYPFWDDLDSETGSVYYQTVGSAPNRTFIVQWETRPHFSGVVGQNITFQAQIDEATGEIFFVYEDVEFGGSQAQYDFGGSASIGATGNYNPVVVSYDDVNYLQNNSCVNLYYTDCPKPEGFSVTGITATSASISWNAGLANENDWTIVYGPVGFDPATGGLGTLTSSNSTVNIFGLDDVTTYDVYIFADCIPGVLQSDFGLLGQISTLPHCSNPIPMTSATMDDSISLEWNWIESSGTGLYPSTGFNLQYGMHGFDLYTGTTVAVDNNFTDTIFDASLMGSGVYDVYFQAVCGPDTSYFVGPLTVIMPLTNDSSCLAEEIPVNGEVHYFSNVGATVQANEANAAPPVTNYQSTTGWGAGGFDATTWYTFTAPTSGNVYISGKDEGFSGQIAIYEVSNCNGFSSYNLVAANDDALDGSSNAPYFSVCGLTVGQTYYLVHDSESSSNTGLFSILLRDVDPEAGTTTGLIEVCSGDTVDLFNGITGYDVMGGTWYEETPTLNFSGSIFPTQTLAFQTFTFEYEVVDGCASDSVMQEVLIYGPSQAGVSGNLVLCLNQEFNLFEGLTGTIDLGGTWYDPSNVMIQGNDYNAGSVPGQFNFDYITGNGVCPEDTSTVLITVDATCNALNVEDAVFEGLEVYPNPTTGVLNIANNASSGSFNFIVYNVNGQKVVNGNETLAQNSVSKVDLSTLETGVYFVEVYNATTAKTFRVVVQ
ncbi:Por secretion system C-terminal sorting domain-containing protein [Lishizhenia tianjinensis]|uniref:Por secretion system C-terminal sorting domain-containing protein n=1 Tax=Lishizhenia tianjinensis TaxID=477690 RepID=A0A1I6YBB3_9FLAO|nr:T9SS type A sorting domain-containing protein [Lishizhenia tianjinensis]SFT47464.1 Por secretion system C-terminal sorting domain-containing protein [Lishizhenia tianjinensis]